VARAEQFRQVEAQQGLAAPFAAFDQQPLFVVNQQHPPRRGVVGEQAARKGFLPVRVVTAGFGAVAVTRGQLQRRGVFVARQGQRGGDGQQRVALAVAVQGQQGQFAFAAGVGQGQGVRLQCVAERGQQR